MNPAMCKKEFLYSWFLNIIQTLLDKVGFSQECKVGIIFENQLVLFTIITKLRNHGITLQSWVKAFYKIHKSSQQMNRRELFQHNKGIYKIPSGNIFKGLLLNTPPTRKICTEMRMYVCSYHYSNLYLRY